MSLLATLAFATPLFGFSLTPPIAAPLDLMPGGLLGSPVLAQLDDAAPGPGDGDATASDAPSSSAGSPMPEPSADAPRSSAGSPMPAPSAEPPSAGERSTADAPSAPSPEAAAASAQQNDFQNVGAQLRQRQEIAAIHRAFGIATWASMLVTEVLGFIQYYNLYGFFGSAADTPCVQGTAVFGQDQCWGEPWPHRIAAITTTALYATTFVLSFVMPDPLGADEGNSELANDLRIHETLRWIHLGGMIAQVLLGLAVGENWFGIDRANDFGAMQAIATVHQVIGLGTFGVLTAAGAIMLF